MTTALAIAPVRKSIRVNVSQAHRLIDVVTAGLEPRWPLHHGIGKMPRKALSRKPVSTVMVPTCRKWHRENVGKIIAWEPPKRFVSGSRTRLGSASALLRGAEIV